MKRTPLIICVLILCAAILCSCSGAAVPGEDLMKDTKADENLAFKFKSGKTETPASYYNYKNYSTDFAFRLLCSMYQGSENTASATAGLYSQLSILENAAANNSLKELKNLTGKNQDVSSLNECNAYFFSRLKALQSKKKGYYVDINNNLFFNKNVNAGQQFLLKNADFFKHGIYRLDFSAEGSRDSINDFVASQTDDKISEILKSPLPDNSDIISTGTSLMRDQWLGGYDREDTSTAKFKTADGEVDAEFMTSVEYYLKGKKCSGFEKSFRSTPCKFIALLPNEDTTVYEFIKSLNYDEYQRILSSMSVFKTCEASLPKFSVKFEDKLNDVLNKNGVYELFNQKGDLKNLSLNFKGSVGEIVSSFSLDINEAGVGVSKPKLSTVEKKKPDAKVRLNRPFVFLIVDNESYIPIFAGIVTKI